MSFVGCRQYGIFCSVFSLCFPFSFGSAIGIFSPLGLTGLFCSNHRSLTHSNLFTPCSLSSSTIADSVQNNHAARPFLDSQLVTCKIGSTSDYWQEPAFPRHFPTPPGELSSIRATTCTAGDLQTAQCHMAPFLHESQKGIFDPSVTLMLSSCCPLSNLLFQQIEEMRKSYFLKQSLLVQQYP